MVDKRTSRQDHKRTRGQSPRRTRGQWRNSTAPPGSTNTNSAWAPTPPVTMKAMSSISIVEVCMFSKSQPSAPSKSSYPSQSPKKNGLSKKGKGTAVPPGKKGSVKTGETSKLPSVPPDADGEPLDAKDTVRGRLIANEILARGQRRGKRSKKAISDVTGS